MMMFKPHTGPGLLRISGLQMLVSQNVPDNEERILAAIERAASDRADFLLTPEGSLSGYYDGFDREQVAAAEERLVARARERRIGLALGTCWKEIEDDKHYCYNQVRLYAPDGSHLGAHSKILRCSQLDHPGTGEMVSYVEGTLRTFEWNGARFGALICNDFWATPGCTTMPNPYLPWKLKQMGARIILHAVNSGHDQSYRTFHESSVELWARALRVYVIEVNALHVADKRTNARSGLVGPDGKRLLVAPDTGEQYFTCEVPPQ